MKTSIITLFLLFFTGLVLADDTTYTTNQILDQILQSPTTPDVTLSTRGRAGYGTSEFLYEEPQTDLYGGVLLTFDILSTSDIRKRREAIDSRRSEVLALLSTIKEHLNLSWQYSTQRASYKERLEWHKNRIELNLEEPSVAYPIEKIIIDLNSNIYKEQAEIQRAQLAISAYAGEEWEDLYEMVKLWDRTL